MESFRMIVRLGLALFLTAPCWAAEPIAGVEVLRRMSREETAAALPVMGYTIC